VCAVLPDMARVSVGVSVRGSGLAQLRDEVGVKMRAGRQALLDGGVEEQDIATTRLNIHNYRNNDQRSEYQVSTMVSAAIRRLDGLDMLVNEVLDAVADGAELHGINFDKSDRSIETRSAREAAFEDAKDKAEHLAALAGVALGAVASIGEEPFQHGPSPRLARMSATAESAAAIPIDGGELIEQATISVTWLLS
jgi:uncharacterized protein YggE